jgi:hypothetical protein
MAFSIISPLLQVLDDNANSLSGGKVYIYEPGTTTPKDSYPTSADADAATDPNANPVVLNAGGRAQIWGVNGESYKVVITTSADVTIATVDDIGGGDAESIDFEQAGTGVVVRSVRDKLMDTVSVFDFMTASQKSDVRAGTALVDVSTAVQTAVDEISDAGGGVLSFPHGSFSMEAGFSVLSNNVVLRGEGFGASILKFRTTGAGITLGALADPIFRWGIEGLQIRDEDGTGTIGVDLAGAREGAIVNSRIIGAGGNGWTEYGLKLGGDVTNGGWTNRFDRMHVMLINGDGVYLQNQINAAIFNGCLFTTVDGDLIRINVATGCKFIGCQFEGADVAIHVAGKTGEAGDGRALGLGVSNCYFELSGPGTTGKRALLVDEADSVTTVCYDLSFTDNYVFGSLDADYAVESAASGTRGVISGNSFNGFVTGGVLSSGVSDRLLVIGDPARPNFDGSGSALPLFVDTSGSGISTAITVGQEKGTTAGRPTAGLMTGQQYYDATLKRPVWYNGSAWVDPQGTISGGTTYDPVNLVDGAGVTTTVPATGAALGDFAEASFSNALQGITLTAWVSAADTVSVRFQNETGGDLDLASGTLRVRVRPK